MPSAHLYWRGNGQALVLPPTPLHLRYPPAAEGLSHRRHSSCLRMRHPHPRPYPHPISSNSQRRPHCTKPTCNNNSAVNIRLYLYPTSNQKPQHTYFLSSLKLLASITKSNAQGRSRTCVSAYTCSSAPAGHLTSRLTYRQRVCAPGHYSAVSLPLDYLGWIDGGDGLVGLIRLGREA